jgi:hypothetical protein
MAGKPYYELTGYVAVISDGTHSARARWPHTEWHRSQRRVHHKLLFRSGRCALNFFISDFWVSPIVEMRSSI